MNKMRQDMSSSHCNWLTTWSQSQKGLGLFPINDNGHTVAYQIPIQNSGDRIRLSLGNYYGESAFEVAAITVSDKADRDFKQVTVGGERSFVLEINQTRKTDELEFAVTPGSKLYVRIYYPEQSEDKRAVSGSIFGLDPKRFESGDCSQDNTLSIDKTYVDEFVADPYAVKFSQEFDQFKQRYTLTIQGVDVRTKDAGHTIVAFGDSITEQNHWVGPLQEQIARTSNHRSSVVNAGISGNRLLKQIANLPRRAQYFGLSGVDRFEHDVFEVNTNVSTVIVSLGVNDIHQPGTDDFFCIDELPTFKEMVDGFEKLISIAHQHNSRIILATISPFIGYAKDAKNSEKELLRQALNEWIRHNSLIDDCYDFDNILADTEIKSRLNEIYDSGDKLHPSATGGKALLHLIDSHELIA